MNGRGIWQTKIVFWLLLVFVAGVVGALIGVIGFGTYWLVMTR